MTAIANPEHPAKWSQPILDLVGRLLDEEADLLGRRLRVIDPMGGVGRIHDLGHDTVSGDLEMEWAACRRPSVVADAARPPFRPGCFDAYVTSPAYGNRFSDHHRNRDPHKKCAGAGCAGCKGSGLSPRKSYTHALGRPLTAGNTGAMAWGEEYRAVHERLWAAVPSYIRPGGLVIVNVSNFIRRKQVVAAMEWHLGALRRVGLRVEDLYAVPTSRMRAGRNYEARVPYEHVIVMRWPG